MHVVETAVHAILVYVKQRGCGAWVGRVDYNKFAIQDVVVHSSQDIARLCYIDIASLCPGTRGLNSTTCATVFFWSANMSTVPRVQLYSSGVIISKDGDDNHLHRHPSV